MKYVVAAQFQVASDDIAHHERFRVAHVQVARWVRKHVEHVAALRRTVIGGYEGLVLLPERLPSLLGGARVVAGPLRTRGIRPLGSLLQPLDLLGHDVVSSPWLRIAAPLTWT